MPITTYRQYFFDHIRGQAVPVFHSANIFPGDYSVVRAVTFFETDDPVTVGDRLMPRSQSYRLNRIAFWVESEWPFGKWIHQYLFDPIYFADEAVTWRNYEASRDVAELEPASRTTSTYLLQEYFVPVERFDEFVPEMRRVLQTHDVNVVNVSIRHSTQDSRSLLAWARAEVFAFVVYYKQRTDERALTEAGVWTRELIDAALSVAGSYYLPYQLYATEAEFRHAYPRAAESFALKQQLDPTNKFRNELLDKYYHPATTSIR